MDFITLYKEELHAQIKNLSPLHHECLLASLPDLPQRCGVTPEALEDLFLSDLPIDYEQINWVSKDRDLSKVEPLSVDSDYFAYDRQAMQPLLDALEKGDFELAEALTPAKYRLCGYQEYTEAKTEEERGIGWAGQFADIVVPAGIYPVFAHEFQYHEAKHCYTNRLRDYSGFFTWVEGQCIASSYEQGKFPYPRTLTESPYCHAVAHSILEGKGDIYLIYPFKAVEHPFTGYDGKDYVTHQIIDSRLPELVQENPMKLRGFGPVEEGNRKNIIKKCNQMEAAAAALGVELLTKPDAFIDDDHLDRVWYGGYMGGLKYKGYELSIEVQGDVCLAGEVNGEDFEYENRDNTGSKSASDPLRNAFKNDKELLSALEDGEIYYENNNWIEGFVKSPDGHWSSTTVVAEDENVLDACTDVSGWVAWLKENFIQKEEEKPSPLDQQISDAAKRTEPQADKTAPSPEKGR